MQPIVLFRSYDRDSEKELKVCQEYFPVHRFRSQVPPNSLVIGRYSVLPYYYELEMDLKANGSRLINSHHQHRHIANFDYYQDIIHLTPKTWFDVTEASKAVSH